MPISLAKHPRQLPDDGQYGLRPESCWNDSLRDSGGKAIQHPNSPVDFIVTDSFHTNRVCKKCQAIVFDHCEHTSEKIFL